MQGILFIYEKVVKILALQAEWKESAHLLIPNYSSHTHTHARTHARAHTHTHTHTHTAL